MAKWILTAVFLLTLMALSKRIIIPTFVISAATLRRR